MILPGVPGANQTEGDEDSDVSLQSSPVEKNRSFSLLPFKNQISRRSIFVRFIRFIRVVRVKKSRLPRAVTGSSALKAISRESQKKC
jgi:hypothetical protein